MIGPKVDQPSAADERRAYAVVTDRDDELCQRCLRARGDNRDHRLNRSQGGRTVPSNLQLLCGSGTTGCHGIVTHDLADALREGWRVPSWGDPREWPAARYFRTDSGTVRLGWCLYTDDGRVIKISADEARRRMEGGTQ